MLESVPSRARDRTTKHAKRLTVDAGGSGGHHWSVGWRIFSNDRRTVSP
jgi:hypothetical protein